VDNTPANDMFGDWFPEELGLTDSYQNPNNSGSDMSPYAFSSNIPDEIESIDATTAYTTDDHPEPWRAAPTGAMPGHSSLEPGADVVSPVEVGQVGD